MRKILKLAGFLAAAVLLFFTVLSVAFYYLMRTGEFRRYLISEIEQKTDLKIQLGKADLDVGRILGISFSDVAVSESGATSPALSAETITARVAFWPLLEHRLVFYEVRLRKPEARLSRDKDGRIPLLERLLNLPFLKQDNGQFTFDLRTVRIAGGEIEFTDDLAEKAPVVTRLHEVTLVLERMRGRPLGEFLRKWMRSTAKPPQREALQFELAAALERGGQRAQWRGQGKLVFPGETLDFARVWCDMDARISGTPAAMARFYGDGLPGVKTLGGSLISRLRFEGDLNQRWRASGRIDFEGLSVDAPEWFDGPLNAGDAQLQFDVGWQPERWEISQMAYRSRELDLNVKGQIRRLGGGDSRLRLDLNAKPFSIAALKKYFPAKWLASSRIGALMSAMSGGELQIHRAGVNATVAEMRRYPNSDFGQRVWFDVEVRNLSANFSAEYLPVRVVDGRIALEKGRVSFENLRGAYGQTRLSSLDGSYSYAPPNPGTLQLRARGEADLTELREQARRGILPAEISEAFLSVQAMAGTGKFEVAFTRAADGAARAEGKLTLEGARLQWDQYALTNITGDLGLAPTEIKADKIRALISGSPVELRLALKNYAADGGRFDVQVESAGVKAGIVSRLLLEKGSLQDPGIVRGVVRYRGSFNDKRDRKLTGNLELFNVQLATPLLLEPLRQLKGKIIIDESGIDFQDLNGLLAGFAAIANGRWRHGQKPQLVFDFAAPNLDISYLISQVDPEATDFYANLRAEGRVVLDKGRIANFEFKDAKSSLILDRRVWRFPNLTIAAAGGSVNGPLTIVHRTDSLSITAEPAIQNVPIAAFLGWLDIATPEISGTVNVDGKLATTGSDTNERKRGLNGAFHLKIADGTIHRLRILVQLLNVLDLSRWFTLQLPDLAKQGIRYRSISGDFSIKNGVYSTKNLIVDSDDLRMTGSGRIDAPKDEVDFNVAVRPFAGIDTAINYIPLIGRGIAAIKNSFLVASFNIRGPIDYPTITPAPLNTVSEWVLGVLGIPKNIIGLGDEKEEKQEPAKENLPAASR